MRKIIKNIFIVLLVLVLFFAAFLYLLIGTYNWIKTDLTQYEQDIQKIGNASVFMPDLESLGSYTDINYSYKVKCYSPLARFYSDGFALFVTYEDAQYQAYKAKVLTDYAFLQEPVKRSQDTYELPVTEFSYKNYHIKIVPDEEYVDFCACKSFLMIGFNDDDSRIVYLYYYDFDIDYIAIEGEDTEKRMCALIDSAFEWIN